MKIRREGITEENIKLYQDEYEIKNYVEFVINTHVFEKDRKVLLYHNHYMFSPEWYKIYKEFRKNNNNDTSSLEYFIMMYGSDGERRFNEKNKKTAITLENQIRRYGEEEGRRLYNETVKKKSPSLENQIRLYGEEEGKKRWDSICESNRKNHSLERKIEIYGEEEGLRKYNISMEKLKNKNTLDYYIKLFGDEIGKEKYYNRNMKNSANSFGAPIGSDLYNSIREKQEKLGKWVKQSDKSEYRIYYENVWKVTKKQPLHKMEFFELRNHQKVSGSYSIDHKISIKYGFKNNIDYNIIGDITNLQMLPHYINSSKGAKCYSVIKYNKHLSKNII